MMWRKLGVCYAVIQHWTWLDRLVDGLIIATHSFGIVDEKILVCLFV